MAESTTAPTPLTPPALGIPKFPDPSEFVYHYDKQADTLSLSIKNPPAAVSYDVGGEAWIRIVPATGQITGIEIEDYQRVFLPKHPELAAAWQSSRGKKPIILRSHAQRQGFLDRLVAFLKQRYASQLQQASAPV